MEANTRRRRDWLRGGGCPNLVDHEALRRRSVGQGDDSVNKDACANPWAFDCVAGYARKQA